PSAVPRRSSSSSSSLAFRNRPSRLSRSAPRPRCATTRAPSASSSTAVCTSRFVASVRWRAPRRHQRLRPHRCRPRPTSLVSPEVNHRVFPGGKLMTGIRPMFAVLMAMLFFPAPVAARAATGIAAAVLAPATPQRVTEGTLLFRTEGTAVPAPLLNTDVDLHVTGPIARAIVRQEFVNPTAAWVEGVYVFPLPEDAAVDHLRLRVGDRVLEGVIRERAAAKATYEQAKREGRRTGLVEQERANIFTTSVANIAPGAAIAVEIEYQQTLRWNDGRYRLRFPMVVGPRYIPGTPIETQNDGTGWGANTDVVPDASRITPLVIHPSRGAINPVTLHVTLAPGGPLARL